MGRLIVLFLIVASVVIMWQVDRYKTKKRLEKLAESEKSRLGAKRSVNDLINSVNQEIESIEQNSTLNAVEAEAKLKFHKQELEQLEMLKNKLS